VEIIWLKGNQGEKRLMLRTNDEIPRTISEILIENGQGRGYVDPVNVLDSRKIDCQLVRIMKPARSFGCGEFKYPMPVPHTRVLVPSDLERSIREWCAVHGFEDVVANPAEIFDGRLPRMETRKGLGQYVVLVVYASFGARIWFRDDDASFDDARDDGTPLCRFPFKRPFGSVLVRGGPGFDGFAGIRFPNDPQGEQEFRELLDEAASWLAEWQAEYGWDHTSDWRGWSDDNARAYAVALFQGIQKVLDPSLEILPNGTEPESVEGRRRTDEARALNERLALLERFRERARRSKRDVRDACEADSV
jgi:hypothetical protein